MNPTYKEQFDKITKAYIEGTLDPYQPCACFVGNLLNNRRNWINARNSFDFEKGKIYFSESNSANECIWTEGRGFYTTEEIIKLEYEFLKYLGTNSYPQLKTFGFAKRAEEALFEAMVHTLEKLRELHESKGENTEFIPLKKREIYVKSGQEVTTES